MKIEVDEIMTDLPQTAREQAIAIIREARKVYENHAGDGAWIAMEQAYAKLIESALSRSSDGPRTPAIQLQARRADGGDWVDIFPAQLQWMAKEDHEVRAVERCSDETAHNVRDATIKEIARYLDEEGHGIPAEKVRFMGPAVTRPHGECA